MKDLRLWYTTAMKALLFFKKRLIPGLLCSILAILVCCSPSVHKASRITAENTVYDREDMEAHSAVSFSLLSGEDESFVQVYESDHALAFVSAHAVDEERIQDLICFFEESVFPRLSVPTVMELKKLRVLFNYMDGTVYGYMQATEQGPIICLNALYADDFRYTLAHEYQHLCAYDACLRGSTSLTEETDELFSDIFCEMLFPGQGTERGILTAGQADLAQSNLKDWGEEALTHAYTLLREGYSEEEVLLILETGKDL